ncbi:2-polyprenyl-6-methoxyphenol hydroxylase [Halobacillus karajensis]|uniref:FAD-dependent monooxygenase n=1 Tax=Halobacillus karajensis TaxID=195088 RepID=UPI0008A77E28|nr:FAD-dependent monooxygenase [Halobacillus karajensis]SEI01525.1 2-polyprenyl-6-methoxyphenol hydroxylase [Halobacillus karajensis]
MQQLDTDVLIVGAGPTGLMMANQLNKYGVRYQIIDENDHPSIYSKALVIHARTMEMLELLGLANKMVNKSFITHHLNFYYNDEPLFTMDVSRLRMNTDYPFISILPQSKTEKMLENNLPANTVQRSTKLSRIQQDEDFVRATVIKDGEPYTITARYVIGCDGAHSTTRELAQMPFEGESENITVMLGDVKTNDPELNHKLSLLSTEHGLLFLAPFQNGYIRVIVIDFDKQGDQFPKEVTLEEIQSSVTKIYPSSLQLKEAFWLSSFTPSHRQVPSYRDKRVFFAGDAAHIHNPLGGQGMNVGMQDAVNLSWKLAYVLNYPISSRLLDTYQEERKPIAQGVIHMTDRLIRAMSVQNKYAIKARNKALQFFFNRPAIQKKIAARLSQIAVDYTFPSFSKPRVKMALPQKGKAGERVPNIDLYTLQEEKRDLYRLLRPGECLFLVYTDEASLPELERQVLKALRVFEQKAGAWLTPVFIIQKNGGRGKNEYKESLFLDMKGDAKDRLGLSKGDVMIIRPDAYSLVRTSMNQARGLKEALVTYFG